MSALNPSITPPSATGEHAFAFAACEAAPAIPFSKLPSRQRSASPAPSQLLSKGLHILPDQCISPIRPKHPRSTISAALAPSNHNSLTLPPTKCALQQHQSAPTRASCSTQYHQNYSSLHPLPARHKYLHPIAQLIARFRRSKSQRIRSALQCPAQLRVPALPTTATYLLSSLRTSRHKHLPSHLPTTILSSNYLLTTLSILKT